MLEIIRWIKDKLKRGQIVYIGDCIPDDMTIEEINKDLFKNDD